MKKAVYKLNVECGRAGRLEGLFIAPKEHVKLLIEKQIEVYFGEVLGKHSEIYGSIEKDDIEFVTDEKTVVNLFEKHSLASGVNPFEYTTINFDFEGNEIVVTDDDCFDDLTVGEIVEQLVNKAANG